MHTAYLLLGSNTGQRKAILARARKSLVDAGCSIPKSSSLWETAPWGNTDQGAFLNQALEISTTLPPMDLLQLLLSIEEKEGRIRTGKWAPRTLDMDILFYDEEIIDVPGLTVPHPHLPQRRFALTPLAQIAPDYMHPHVKQTVKALLAACPDESGVFLLP